jgi:DNA-directed RNA polymerase subunit RPC12/RpoP
MQKNKQDIKATRRLQKNGVPYILCPYCSHKIYGRIVMNMKMKRNTCLCCENTYIIL